MLSLFSVFTAAQVSFNYDSATGEFKVTTTEESDSFSEEDINAIFPDERNWTSLVVEGPILEIPPNVFSNAMDCANIKLPETVKRIGEGGFSYSSIIEFTTPAACNSLGLGAFEGCEDLSAFYYHKACYQFNDNCFRNCIMLEKFVVVDGDTTTQPENVSVFIGRQAFMNCPILATVMLPQNIEEIFEECFNGDQLLSNIVLPSTIYSIPKACFQGCSALHSIDLSAIEYIGEYAFAASGIEEITTSERLIQIDNYAFTACEQLIGVSKLTTNPNYTFGTGTFESCPLIESFSVPQAMHEIPPYAFSGCQLLKTIKFNNAIQTIGRGAFYNTGFETFEIPADIEFIDEAAFVKMLNLKEFTIDHTNEHYGVDKKNGFLYNKESMEIILFPQASALSSVSIQKEYKVVGYGAFAYCKNLVKVEFLGELDHICNNAFYYCTGLTGVLTIPQGCIFLGDKCFAKCEGINEVEIKEGTFSLSSECFAYCTSLSKITIPESMQDFGENCFKKCISLTKIDCKKTKLFGPFCFSSCSALTDIKISEDCISINTGVFSYCTSLKEVRLSSNLTRIHSYAFNGAGIETIYIPETCKRIDDHAFRGTQLKSIIIPSKVSEIPLNLLANTSKLETVKFMGEISILGEGIFENSTVKEITFYNSIQALSDNAFRGSKPKVITYCAEKKVDGISLEKFYQTKVHTTPKYNGETFGGHKIDNKDQSFCPPPRTPSMTPLPTPVATEVPISALGTTGWIIAGGVLGGIVLIGIIICAVIPCVMKRHGWAKKETLTESLLTQTV